MVGAHAVVDEVLPPPTLQIPAHPIQIRDRGVAFLAPPLVGTNEVPVNGAPPAVVIRLTGVAVRRETGLLATDLLPWRAVAKQDVEVGVRPTVPRGVARNASEGVVTLETAALLDVATTTAIPRRGTGLGDREVLAGVLGIPEDDDASGEVLPLEDAPPEGALARSLTLEVQTVAGEAARAQAGDLARMAEVGGHGDAVDGVPSGARTPDAHDVHTGARLLAEA